jgi:hypothetical protein
MFAATIAALALLWLWFWKRTRDPFHPAIYMLPQFLFIYGWLPMSLQASDPDRFARYAGGDFLYVYHALAMGLVATLIGGVVYATRGATRQSARWRTLAIKRAGVVRLFAFGLGLIGIAAFLYGVSVKGGFAEVYGSAYGSGGGGGYVKEMRFIGLVGAIFVYLTRVGRRMRPSDWTIVALCVAPTMVHGLLGARRGPTFLALVTLAGGYVYFMRKRVSMPAIIAGGAAVGLTMLFLVANRESIYLGSDAETFRDPLEFLLRWSGNEYLVGTAVVRYANEVGPFYGVRELSHVAGRLLPNAIWPTIYTDLPAMFGFNIDLRVNVGMNPLRLAAIVGWMPSIGSAEGFAASLWMEFGLAAFPVAFFIGMFYGRVWLAARDSVAARVTYLLMVALSVYLVMQNIDPWLYRLLMLGLPAYLAVRFVRVRPTAPVSRRESSGLAVRMPYAPRPTRAYCPRPTDPRRPPRAPHHR